MKICFVCHANVCRSFMSQEILKNILAQKGITDIEVFSRGTFVFDNLRVPDKIKKFLKKNGIEYTTHTPTLISKQDLESADMLFVMTQDQLEELTDKYSQFSDKIFLLLDYCYEQQKDIDDPINKEGFSFNRAAKNLKQTIEVLSNKLITNH